MSARQQKYSRCTNQALSHRDRANAVKLAFAHIVERNNRQTYMMKEAILADGGVEVLCSIIKGDESTPLPIVLEKGFNIWDLKGPEWRYKYILLSYALLALRRLLEVGIGEKNSGARRVRRIIADGALAGIIPHLSCLECSAGNASGCLKEIARWEEYRQAVIDAGALQPLCYLLRCDAVQAKTSFRNAAECLHLLSCTSVDRFEEYGILDACVAAAINPDSGEKVIVSTALCAANITAGRDDPEMSKRMDVLYERVQLGAHISRCLQSSLPQRTGQRANYLAISWTQLDILRSISLLAASNTGRKQLISTWGVKDSEGGKNLNIVDLLHLVLVTALNQQMYENVETALEVLLHFSFSSESAALIRSCKDMMTLLNYLAEDARGAKCEKPDDQDEDGEEDASFKSIVRNILLVLNGQLGVMAATKKKATEAAVADIGASGVVAETDNINEEDDNSSGGQEGNEAKSSGSGLLDVAGGTDPTKNGSHVMVSYSWAHQELVLEVCRRLQSAAIPYWLDVEQMHGYINDRMAEAIENCSAVIVFASSKYKLSANCRMEAEYGCASKKKMIPVIAEDGYRPDGWLGLILSGKLWYDMSTPAGIDKNIHSLVAVVRPLVGSEGCSRPNTSGDAQQPPAAQTLTQPVPPSSTPDSSVDMRSSMVLTAIDVVDSPKATPTSTNVQAVSLGDIKMLFDGLQVSLQSGIKRELEQVVTLIKSVENRLDKLEKRVNENVNTS